MGSSTVHITAKQAAKLIGISKTAVINALESHKLSGDKNEEGHWMVDAADATRYRDSRQHKTANQQQVVDGIKANVDSGLQVVVEAKDKLIYEQNQRISDLVDNHAKVVAAKDEVIQSLRLLSDQRAKEAGQLPTAVVEKIAKLEAENELTAKAVAKAEDDARALARQLQEVQEVARRGVDIAPEELAELRRKAKIIDDNKAAQEILTQLKAQYDALPFFKRMAARAPTLEMAKVALKEKQSTNQQTSEPPAAKAG